MKLKATLAPLLFLAALPLGALAADLGDATDGSSQETLSANQSGRDNQDIRESRDERSGQMSGQGSGSMSGQGAGSADDPPMFRELDTNHDGYITKEEAKRSADVTARFNDLDTDRDGRISSAEFRKGMQPKY